MASAVEVNAGQNSSSATMQNVSHDQIFSKIQELLPDSICSDDVAPVLDLFEGKLSESVKLYVETAVRYYVTQNLCNGLDTDLSKITAVAKISIELTRKEVCLPTLPMLVLSDAFDSLTVQQCEKLFSYVESNVSTWKEALFFIPSKNQVLRMCNDVLRRLSRSQNTIFCGRILLFLARFFPFSERSGLNLISEFNLENITTYTSSGEPEEPMDGIEGTKDDNDVIEETSNSTKQPVNNFTLYSKFWALQDFFRNPIQCYQKEAWKQFTSYTNVVLEAFESSKLDSNGRQPSNSAPYNYSNGFMEMSDSNADDTIIDCLPDSKKTDQYFAKFLTNQRLLELQFSDSNFRRYVLVQLLILCHYLTVSIKFKQENLGDAETAWVRDTESKVYSLLKETPPDGEVFAEIVQKILKRENQWNDWKNNGCPEIKKPVPAAMNGSSQNGKVEVQIDDDEVDKKKCGRKRKIGDLIKEADSKKKFIMTNNEMTRLWNMCPDNVEATRQQKRDFIPSLEHYFTKAIHQIQATDSQPASEKLVHDGNFGWRGLRLLANRSPHFFTHSTAPIATLPEYLTTMIKKLAKDMPNTKPAPSQMSDEVKEEIKQEEEVIPDQNEDNNCEEMEEEEEDGMGEREELTAITTQEQQALAAKVAAIGGNKWGALMKKLGFQVDEVDYILKEKGGSIEQCCAHFLQLWVENEGDEANRDAIIYILGGVKMADVASAVFQS